MNNDNPPQFKSPTQTISPTVRSLTENDELFIEKGVSFSKYISLKPLDPMDLIKNSGVLCYYFKDSSVFINTKRIFLEIEKYLKSRFDVMLYKMGSYCINIYRGV